MTRPGPAIRAVGTRHENDHLDIGCPNDILHGRRGSHGPCSCSRVSVMQRIAGRSHGLRRFGRRLIVRAFCHVSAIPLLTFGSPTAAFAQTQLGEQAVVTIDGEALQWSGVVATDANDSLLAVMTESDPVLHLFLIRDGRHVASWGRRGEGPGEFESSAGMALAGDRVYALDTTQRRIAIFDLAGVLIESTLLNDLPFPFADRLHRARGDTVFIGAFEPMGQGRTVTAWTSDGFAKEVLAYQAGTRDDLIRLEAPDAPGLTLPGPFRTRPLWSVDQVSGNILYWPGQGRDIQVIGLDGSIDETIPLPVDDLLEVTSEDREHWIQTGIPRDFQGIRAFEPLRRVARDIVEFPEHHPLLYNIISGPHNTMWLRRTPNGRSQIIWDVVTSRGTSRVLLSRGQKLLGLHSGYAVILMTDDIGQEVVELRLVQELGRN